MDFLFFGCEGFDNKDCVFLFLYFLIIVFGIKFSVWYDECELI